MEAYKGQKNVYFVAPQKVINSAYLLQCTLSSVNTFNKYLLSAHPAHTTTLSIGGSVGSTGRGDDKTGKVN